MNITVWAPSAKSVELVTPERRIPMHPRAAGCAEAPGNAGATVAGVRGRANVRGYMDGPGYWHTEVDDSVLAHGYRYSVDGGEPIPDPRSMWQPDGVHGASRLVDTERLSAPQPYAPQPYAPRPYSGHPHGEGLHGGRDSGIRDDVRPKTARYAASHPVANLKVVDARAYRDDDARTHARGAFDRR